MIIRETEKWSEADTSSSESPSFGRDLYENEHDLFDNEQRVITTKYIEDDECDDDSGDILSDIINLDEQLGLSIIDALECLRDDLSGGEDTKITELFNTLISDANGTY